MCEGASSAQRLAEAGDRARTGDPNLGKVVLYQLSYTRVASFRGGDYKADSFFLSKPKYPWQKGHHNRDSVPCTSRCRLPRCAPTMSAAAALAAITSGSGSPRNNASSGTTSAAIMEAADT